MEIIYTQNIYYSNKEKIPIKEVANALLALEGVSTLTPKILEKLFDDLTVKHLDVYVEDLETGSLKERIQYYLSVAFQKNISDISGVEYKNLEGQSNDKKANIVGWAIAALVLIALKFAAEKVFPDKETPNINQQINITLEAGRDITGHDTEKLLKTISSVIDENPKTIKNAVDFIKPAKKEQGASLKLEEEIDLTSDILREIPLTIQDDMETEKVVELNDAELMIRATDRDSGRQGWAATIPIFNEKRLRMHVAPGIDLNYLAHKDIVIGNVAIFYKVNSDGEIIKPHVHLFEINKEATEKIN